MGSPTNIIERYNRKNWLINGDFQISQRGDYTSPFTVADATYNIDRWKSLLSTPGLMDIQHLSTNQPSALSDSKSIKMIANVTSSHFSGLFQWIEDFEKFKDKVVTFSAWVKSNTVNATLRLNQGSSSYSNPHSGNGTWELLTLTTTISNGATGVRCYVSNYDGSTNAITAGDYIEFTGAKLEIGEFATPFQPRPLIEELLLCQRYFHIIDNTDNGGLFFLQGRFIDATRIDCLVRYPITMRAVPSCTYTNGTGGFYISVGTTSYTVAAISFPHMGKDRGRIRYTASSGTSQGYAGQVGGNSTDQDIRFDAELY